MTVDRVTFALRSGGTVISCGRRAGRLFLMAGGALLWGCATAPTTTTVTRISIYHSPCQEAMAVSGSGRVIGYGEGRSVAEARQQAYQHIVEQLRIQVATESVSTVEKVNAQVDTRFVQKISSSGEAALQDLETVCTDELDPNGRVHVAVMLDRRPLTVRLVERVLERADTGFGHSLIGPAPLLRSVPLQTLASSVDGPDSGSATMPVSLHYAAGRWQLLVGRTHIPFSDDELPQLLNWNALADDGLAIQIVDIAAPGAVQSLHEFDEFRVHVVADQTGLLTLLHLDENGIVTLLRGNQPITPDARTVFPDSPRVLEAGLIKSGQATHDTYIALQSAGKLDLALLQKSDADGNPQQALVALLNLLAEAQFTSVRAEVVSVRP